VRVLVGFEEFDGLDVLDGRLLIQRRGSGELLKLCKSDERVFDAVQRVNQRDGEWVNCLLVLVVVLVVVVSDRYSN
jgi:hypothetical protein